MAATNAPTDKSGRPYDLILFGATGFTGRLAAEYLLRRRSRPSPDDGGGGDARRLRWAVCARSAGRARAVLEDRAAHLRQENATDDGNEPRLPDVLEADLLAETPDAVAALRAVVAQARVVLTCAGPFERYGQALVAACAELGTDYADVTGETDFVRACVRRHDATARASGARIVHHCGNDCIPQDLTVFEMHAFATARGCDLAEVRTYVEMPDDASVSGGTVATATYQLNKDRSQRGTSDDFDPLLMAPDGARSTGAVRNLSPRSSEPVPELGGTAAPWIMGPVMVNCVRRSNALLRYSPSLGYGDAQLHRADAGWAGWARRTGAAAVLAAGIAAPSLFGRLLPAPGEGPDRDTMERGYLVLHGRGLLRPRRIDGAGSGEADPPRECVVRSTFRFNKDIGYLYTAALLVEAGLLLLETQAPPEPGGVMTPAVAFGGRLTRRIVAELDASYDIKEE